MIVQNISVRTDQAGISEQVQFKSGRLHLMGAPVANLPDTEMFATDGLTPVTIADVPSVQSDRLIIEAIGVQRPSTLIVSGTYEGEARQVEYTLTTGGPWEHFWHEITLPYSFTPVIMTAMMGVLMVGLIAAMSRAMLK